MNIKPKILSSKVAMTNSLKELTSIPLDSVMSRRPSALKIVKQFFSGQLDWVVLAKLGLMMVAVLVVLWAKRNLERNGRSINAVSASAP